MRRHHAAFFFGGGGLAVQILDLFEDILHGRRSDADAVREFLKKRAKLFD